jgi:hypothetical protein
LLRTVLMDSDKGSAQVGRLEVVETGRRLLVSGMLAGGALASIHYRGGAANGSNSSGRSMAAQATSVSPAVPATPRWSSSC